MPQHRPQDGHRKPRRRRRTKLVDLVVGEVSSVDHGANRGSEVLFWKREGLEKLDFRTSRNAGHAHAVELPEVVSEGTFRTEQAAGHDHPIEIPAPVQPGERVTLTTGQGGEDSHTHDVVIEVPEEVEARQVDKQGETKTVDGKAFPASDFAFVPDRSKPSTWKLRLTSTPGGAPDPRIVGAAVAALGPGGFRGQRVQLPAGARAAVKAKVLRAWLKAHPDQKRADAPAVLKLQPADLEAERLEWAMAQFLELEPADQTPERRDRLVGLLAKQEDPEMPDPRSFDEIMESRRLSDVVDGMENRVGALTGSIFEILHFEDDQDRQTSAVLESIDQFKATIETDLPALQAGTIVKAFGSAEDPPTLNDVEALLGDLLAGTEVAPASHGGKPMRKELDVTKLPEEWQGPLGKLWELASKVEGLEKTIQTLTEDVPEGYHRGEDGAITKVDLEKHPYAGLPENVQKLLKRKDAEAAANASEIATMRKKDRRQSIQKSVEDFGELAIAESLETIVDTLEKIEDQDTQDSVVGMLKAANAAALEGLSELGSGLGGDASAEAGSAFSKLEAIAKTIQEAEPTLTFEQSFAKAMERKPELYQEYVDAQS